MNEELKALQQLGTIRETPDGFASQTDKVLSALNERHEKELLKIRETRRGSSRHRHNIIRPCWRKT